MFCIFQKLCLYFFNILKLKFTGKKTRRIYRKIKKILILFLDIIPGKKIDDNKIKEEFLAKYRESNQRTEKITDLNLKERGYY